MAETRGSAIILVVERDPHVRELEGFFLEKAGYRVEFAEDGEDALARVRDIRPDLVITEVLVPGLDGLAVCREIKRDPGLDGTAVLVFSILAVSRRAKEAGADEFLRKPLLEQSLVQMVEKLLSMREESER